MATIIKVEKVKIDPENGPRLGRSAKENEIIEEIAKLAGYTEEQVDLCDTVTGSSIRVTIWVKRILGG